MSKKKVILKAPYRYTVRENWISTRASMRKYRKYVVWYLLAGYSCVLAVGIWSTINFPTVAYPWLRTSVGPLIFPFAYYWSLFYVLVPTELVVRRKGIEVRSFGSARRIEHQRILEVGLDDSQEPHIFWFRYTPNEATNATTPLRSPTNAPRQSSSNSSRTIRPIRTATCLRLAHPVPEPPR